MRHVSLSVILAFVLGAACSTTSPAQPASTTAAAVATSSGATASASTEQARQLPTMTTAELAGMLERHEQVAIYDSNGAERYAQGHIPSARHVGHDQVTASVLPADRAARLVFYCANEHCMACHTSANQAIALGYTNVYVLPAGIMGWTSEGKPVVAGTNPS